MAYIGLGSNLGDRARYLAAAVRLLADCPGTRVLRVSPVYETEPVGVTDQPAFLNAVAEIETALGPWELLLCCQGIEAELGRARSSRWGPRVIDLDILTLGDLRVDETDLTIPHPRLAERAFALRPLADLAPDLRMPDGRSAREALDAVGESGVREWGRLSDCVS